MIELKNISKTYPGGLQALDNINLKIEDGDIYGIIGLSGAGKSTLVRCINLLEKPSEGKVFIDGQNILSLKKNELRSLRRDIGMIFQSFNLLAQRNVFDNVKFPLELIGAKKEEANKKVEELLKLVGLSDRAKSYPSQLSGGQKQRVAIARALATSPKYLLCDEATSALDPTTTDSILELLLNINKELGVTIVLISHDMSVIYSVCNKVAVIDNAHIVEEGDCLEVFKNPKSDIANRLINFKRMEVRK